jgi:hypothetical protein
MFSNFAGETLIGTTSLSSLHFVQMKHNAVRNRSTFPELETRWIKISSRMELRPVLMLSDYAFQHIFPNVTFCGKYFLTKVKVKLSLCFN